MGTRQPRGDDWLKTAEQLERDIAAGEAGFARPEQPTRATGVTVCVAAAAFSAWILYQVVDVLAQYRAMRDWVPAQATITELRLIPGSRTSTLDMGYRYAHDGADCTGGRVNIRYDAGASHFAMYQDAFRKQRPIPIWIDPGVRCRAIIDRDFPAVMGYMALFVVGGSAALVLYIGRRGWKFQA
jgi:hypothetical protein